VSIALMPGGDGYATAERFDRPFALSPSKCRCAGAGFDGLSPNGYPEPPVGERQHRAQSGGDGYATAERFDLARSHRAVEVPV